MTSTNGKATTLAVQIHLEDALGDIVRSGSYEAAYFFTEDGLVLAQYDHRNLLPEQRCTEFALLMNRLKKAVRSLPV
jgi:hypothetical protein